MNPELEETIYCDFITSSPTTGAAIDADTTPTAEVFEDATDTAILSPTVTKRTSKTGNYRVPVACTAANGFEAGKSYNVAVAATVGAVAAKAIIHTFQMRTNGADDLAASILTRATPAQVQAELVTYGAAKPGNAMTLTSPYDPAKTAAQVGSAMTLTAAYDAAKTAATQASLNAVDDFVDTEVNAIKVVTDKLDTALELDGAVYRYTVNALEQAPSGGGGGATDWTDPERQQIRHRLGIDGSATSPSSGNPSLASEADVTALASSTATSFAGVNTKLDAISTGLPLDATELNAIADVLLKRDWTLLSGEAAYSVLNALRMLRNVWNTPAGVLHVKKEDGTTDAWTRTLAVDPTAQPIVGAS